VTAHLLGTTTITAARKAHECECGGVITKGSAYTREFWMVEGEPEVRRIGSHIHTHEEEEERLLSDERARDEAYERMLDEERNGDNDRDWREW